MSILSVEHASVRRKGKYILRDVSLSVNEGEHLAIIGPNGAGKSTLLGVLCKTVHPLALDEYSYTLFGSKKWTVSSLRQIIGHVSQADELLANTTYTVYEIVVSALFSAIGLDFHITPSEEDKAKALAQIEKVGLMYCLDKPFNTLSSGERARTLIARAAVNDPPILMLDEASNALDFPSRSDLRKTISLYAREGKTIIMVTHELSEIIEEVGHVVVMKDGGIVVQGKKEDVLSEDILSSVYGQKVYVDKRGSLYSAWC